MSDDKAPRRYTKGEAKRREILDTALRLIGRQGYGASTLQEIADAVGLTKAGVLHYFESREELIASVLKERDEATFAASTAGAPDAGPPGMLDLLLQASSLNAETPGLVALYSRLVVDAASPDHPAHDYIDDRYDRVVSAIVEEVQPGRSSSASIGHLDPETFARLVVAISDGLQLQWSYRPDFSMHEALKAAIAALTQNAGPVEFGGDNKAE